MANMKWFKKKAVHVVLLLWICIFNGGFAFTSPDHPLKKANQAVKINDFKTAVSILTEFVETHKETGKPSELAEAYFWLANIYNDWKNIDLAKKYLRNLYKIYPNYNKKNIENRYFKRMMVTVKKDVDIEYAKKKVRNDNHFWERTFVDEIVMVYIPAGKLEMGSGKGESDERPIHTVQLDGYWIGKYEITMKQYALFIADTGHIQLPGWVLKHSTGDHHPVIGVSYDDAAAFCKWLSHRTGRHFYLPTEAQWEKAAKGEDRRRFPWGNAAPECNKVNFYKCGKIIKPVGSLPFGRSPYGIFDMAGNVWEWCRDWYRRDYYKESEIVNPLGPPQEQTYRVLRGGSFLDRRTDLRSSRRMFGKPESIARNIGFRICLEERME